MGALPIIRDMRGNVITPNDLPSPETIRWTPNKKFIVVQAIKGGLITKEEALDRWGMLENELRIWEEGFKSHGVNGLKTTHYQKRSRSKPS